MSPREVEEWLGLKPSSQGRSFLRFALDREKELGKKFIIRRGSNGTGTRYLFTREMIRRHLRDLWQARFDRISAKATAAVKRIEAHIDGRIEDRIQKSPHVQALERRVDEMIGLLESLASSVERSARVAKSHKKSRT